MNNQYGPDEDDLIHESDSLRLDYEHDDLNKLALAVHAVPEAEGFAAYRQPDGLSGFHVQAEVDLGYVAVDFVPGNDLRQEGLALRAEDRMLSVYARKLHDQGFSAQKTWSIVKVRPKPKEG